VYLEQRKTENIVRHSLVSVFLRMMEYFRGILILTTNRVEIFDEAILSRIHLKLRYGCLDRDARMTVWKIFFKKVNTRSGAADISQPELETLDKELNGWQVSGSLFGSFFTNPFQIKNTVFTASALPNKKKKPLSISHVQAVLEAGETFDRDFHGTDRSETMYT
jgi:SpoVK/Ycf46/Vps4 family AAA+-type ATPase